ncbi:hypothetical protein EIP86_001542 [Pleurotus ostreatoroseus]|nr:hypothetical protein EIP86_001542 [Pleurotus ostreatoroseus]
MFFNEWAGSRLRDVCRLGLTIATLVLITFNTSIAPSISTATTFFERLASFLNAKTRQKELKTMYQEWSADSASSKLPDYMTIGNILQFFCEALEAYASSHRIPEEHAPLFVRISTTLHSIYPFYRTPKSLHSFDVSITDLSYPFAMELLDEGWDGHLVALVLVEEMEEKDMILESVMEALVLAETRPPPKEPPPKTEVQPNDNGKRHA